MLIGSIGIGLTASTAQLAADLDRAAARLDAITAAAGRSQRALDAVRLPAQPGPAPAPLRAEAPAPAGGGPAPATPAATPTATPGTMPPIGAEFMQAAALMRGALEPMVASIRRIETMVDALGGTFVTLARRIDASMKFSVLNATIMAVREKLAGLAGAIAPAGAATGKVQRRIVALAAVADRALAVFRGFAAVQNYFTSLGDVAARTAGQIGLVGEATAAATTAASGPLGGLATLLGGPIKLLGSLGGTITDAFGSLGGAILAPFRAIAGALNPLRAVEDATTSLRSTILGLGRDVLIAFGVFAAGYKIAEFLRHGIAEAANLNETVDKTGRIFGSATAQVMAQADNLAHSFGLLKRPLLDAASGIGLILQGSGQAVAASAKLSNRLVQLAVDATSLYNVPLDVSLDRIKSGLIGQSRPMREFGVLMDEDEVKQEALRMGLAKGGQELGKYAKVMARASLIQKGLAVASGNLAATFGSAANQFRRSGGGLANFGAAVGQVLLPIVQQGTLVFNEFLASTVEAFERNRPALEAFAGRIKGLVAAIGPAVAGIPEAFRRVARVFGPLVESVGAAVRRVALVFAGLFTDRPEAAVARIAATIRSAFSQAGTVAGGAFNQLLVVLRNLPDYAEVAALKVREVLLQIPVVAGRAWPQIVAEASWAARAIATVFGNVPAAVGAVFDPLADQVNGVFVALYGDLAAVVAAAGGTTAAVGRLGAGIVAALLGPLEFLRTSWDTIQAAFRATAAGLVDAVARPLAGLAATGAAIVADMAAQAAAAVAGLAAKVGAAIAGLGSVVAANLGAALAPARDAVGGFTGWAGGAFRKLADTIGYPFQVAGAVIQNTIGTALGWIKDRILAVFGAIGEAMAGIASYISSGMAAAFRKFTADMKKVGSDLNAEMARVHARANQAGGMAAKVRAALGRGVEPRPLFDLKGLFRDLPTLDRAIGAIHDKNKAAAAARPLSERFRAMGAALSAAFDPARLTPLEAAGRRTAGVLSRTFNPDNFRDVTAPGQALARGLAPAAGASARVAGALGGIARAAGLARGPVAGLAGQLAGAEARAGGLRSLAGAGQAIAGAFVPAQRAIGGVVAGLGQVARAAGLAQGPAARLAEALARRITGRPAVPAPIEVDEDLQKRAATITKDTLTPFEKFQAGVKDLKAMLAAGLISKDVFGRAFLKQGAEFAQQSEVKVQHAGALELGSAEFRSAILKFRGAGERDPVKKVAELTAQQLALQKQQHETEKKTAAAVQQLAGSFLRFVF